MADKKTLLTGIKKINKDLLDMGFTEKQILEFWENCKKEAKAKEVINNV